jgi:Flp pilus assembly protein TadG
MNRKQRQRGAATVEFGLAFLLFFTFIISIMEFGRIVSAYNILAGATREASRYATVHGSASGSPATDTDIQSFYNTFPGARSNQYDGVTITTTGTVNLAAPTAGASKGLLFHQDPRVAWTASNGSYFAGTNAVYTGILYFPSTDMQYSGSSTTNNAGTDGYTMLIGYNIKINGSSKINSDYSAISGNPLQNALFAE